MRKNISIILGLLFCCYYTTVNAQVLTVEKVRQSQTYWCWVGVSKCVLKYYGKDQEQCTIAEYARTRNPVKFGNTDCCKPDHSCNLPNSFYDGPGRIDDILNHFGSIKSRGQWSSLDEATITFELQNNRPFIFRWGWKSSNLENGHFMVGHGLKDGDFYYMDPDKDAGFMIKKYGFVVESSRHKWTHTLVLESNVGLPESLSTTRQFIYPNPASSKISFREMPVSTGTMIEISNGCGNICYSKPFPASGELDLSELPRGLYVLRMISRDQAFTTKLVLN